MKNLEVIIRKETKRGARFYKYGKHSMRLFPVKTADVELMKVEGTIEIVDSEGNVIWTPAVEVEVVNEEAVAEELNGKHGTITGAEALDYIQSGTIIYKGVNGNLEELKVDLNDLEQLQELVGGNIQTVELPCNIIMVVNESGWVDNLPMNFRLNNLAIFGDVFFCSYNDADFVGLSTRQKRFIKEEIFKQIGARLV